MKAIKNYLNSINIECVLAVIFTLICLVGILNADFSYNYSNLITK